MAIASKAFSVPVEVQADRAPARAERARFEPTHEPGAEPLSVAQIYRQYGDTVARWALRLGGPRFDAADAIQEVFAVVARRLPTFRAESSMATWLFGITENVVRQFRRRERGWLRLRHRVSRVEPLSVPLPGDSLERSQVSELVYAALEQVREPYRSALILFELEGLSGGEIALLKGCKVATVWVWLHRGRAAFLRELTTLGATP